MADLLVAAVLCGSYVGALLATSEDLAMSRDESFYVMAAENSARWLQAVWDEPGRLTEAALISQHWEYNHEHPGLMKLLFGASWWLQQATGLFGTDSAAFRFPGMLTAGLLLGLTYVFGRFAMGRAAGMFAALVLALMPRVFYHSHLNCFDIPIVLFMTLTAFCYWRALSSWRWLVPLGVAYGLALATKHNAWILPGVFLIHWLWVRVTAPKPGLRRDWVPWWLLACAGIGVPVFVLCWPWLWHDGWDRWLWYAGFHTNHVHYPMAYLGRTYSTPPFPVSFPWVMTAVTLPATSLLLIMWGMVLQSPQWLPGPLVRFAAQRLASWTPRTPDFRRTAVLWMGCLLAPLVTISLPNTPIFGGTKHWMSAYPFMALFAGVAFSWLCAKLPRLPARRLVPAAVATVLLTPAAVETAHSHPFGLSHYTLFAGHVPGAADLGMNRQFWGFTQGSLSSWFKKALPQGGTIWPCDATHQAWMMMHRDGMLPANIRPAHSMASADYILVHHEHHFAEVDGQAWVVTGDVAPVKVLSYDGVPIVSVYRNPR